MDNMSIEKLVSELQELKSFVFPNADEGDEIELIIRTDSRELPVRSMAAFLQITDRIYGRLDDKGLKSYAQIAEKHVRFYKIQAGSFEMILLEKIANTGALNLLIVYVCLTSGLPALAKSYKYFQEGELARQQKKQVKKELQKNEVLKNQLLNKLDALSALVLTLLENDSDIKQAYRFLREHIINLEIRLKKE